MPDTTAYSKRDQLKRKPRPKPKDGYAEATERARHREGYLRCESCGHSIAEGQETRHHIVFRSHGGDNSASNLRIVCPACHRESHGL